MRQQPPLAYGLAQLSFCPEGKDYPLHPKLSEKDLVKKLILPNLELERPSFFFFPLIYWA